MPTDLTTITPPHFTSIKSRLAGLFNIYLVNVMISLTLVCFALVLLSAISVSTLWQHEIIVDWKKGNDSTCLEEGTSSPCATVNMALKGLKSNSTVIHIKPGTYILEPGPETNITKRYMIAIIGSGEEDTVIKCAPSVGLSIISSNDVTIESVTFQECGQNVFYTTHTLNYYSFNFQAAICLMSCHSVILTNVNIHSSNGTGLLIIDATGSMTLYNSSVIESRANFSLGHLKPKQTFTAGGGIVSFSFYKSMHYLNITESHIVNNHMNIFQSVFSYYCNSIHFKYTSTFDLAGGIALFYFSSPGQVLIDSCSIFNNTGGLVLFDLVAYFGVTVNIRNTQYFNHQESTIIVINEHGSLSSLQLFNVITTDQLVIYSDSNYIYSYEELKNRSALSVSSLYLAVQSSDDIKNNLPSFQFEKEYCSYYDFEITKEYSNCPLPYYCYPNDYSDCNYYDHREGTLCGRCEDGYSVAINSLYLSCVSCNETTIAIGWTILMALEFFPVTVMVILIAIVNVNLNQGSFNAFILFCQMSTVSFHWTPLQWLFMDCTDFYKYSDKYAELLNLFIYSLSIWNLDFINFLGESNLSKGYYSICISHSTTPLGAISFWYLIALYPLFLLIVFYVCIVLYEKGYRCVVFFIRPVHRVLARFWRMFKIQPSLTHTVASVYTLCFTLLTTVSIKILFPIQHKGKNYFFYDGTQKYFENLHGLACTFALIVLLIEIIMTIYLSLYPFQFFQKFFSKLKFKKDFLVAVTDVFTGPYKDGTDNSWDYRYFAGIHFALRLFILPFNCIPFVALILPECVYSIIIVTLVIFRPYKRNIHTFNEVFLVASLGVVNSTAFFTAVPASIIAVPIIGFIICFVVIPYCLVWMYKKCTLGIRYMNSFKPKPSSTLNVHQSPKRLNVNYDYSFADRSINPESYDEHHTSTLTDGAMDTD